MIIKGLTIKDMVAIKNTDYYATTFDGINEYVTMGLTSSLSFNSTDPFTITGWVTCTDWNTFAIMLGRINHNSPFNGYTLRTDAGKLRFALTSDTGVTMNVKSSVLNNGQLYFFAVSNDGSGTVGGLNMYIDGALDNFDTFGTSIGGITGGFNFNVGASNIGTANWNGSQDEVAVFDRELSAAEIINMYNRTRINTDYSDIPNLVSHWKMDTLNPVDETGTNNSTSINMDASNIIII